MTCSELPRKPQPKSEVPCLPATTGLRPGESTSCRNGLSYIALIKHRMYVPGTGPDEDLTISLTFPTLWHGLGELKPPQTATGAHQPRPLSRAPCSTPDPRHGSSRSLACAATFAGVTFLGVRVCEDGEGGSPQESGIVGIVEGLTAFQDSWNASRRLWPGVLGLHLGSALTSSRKWSQWEA